MDLALNNLYKKTNQPTNHKNELGMLLLHFSQEAILLYVLYCIDWLIYLSIATNIIKWKYLSAKGLWKTFYRRMQLLNWGDRK